MKNFLKSVVVFGLMLGLSSGLYSNGLNLNGNGSKAIGMGGAFVGLADDFSAVFWNPAGLTQMTEPSLGLFVTDIIPSGGYEFDLLGIDATPESKNYFSGALGFFKPLSEKVVVGIYGYVPSALGVTWDGSELAVLSDGIAYEWETLVAIVTVSPTIAVKVTDKLSLGASLNLIYGLSKLSRPGLGQYEEDLNGTAFGATLGMLFKPTDKFSIGLTFKAPMKAKLSGDATMAGAPLLGLPGTDDAEREVTWPMWIGAGIAFKPNDKLTFTADVQYTNWEKMDNLPITYSNAGWILFFEDASRLELQWEDTVQLRFGVEYKVSDSFALRGGFYTDPTPSPKATQTILLPEISYNFVTFGFGYSTAKINVDVAVEYGIGKDVEVGLTEVLAGVGMPGIHSMNFLVPNISFTFKF